MKKLWVRLKISLIVRICQEKRGEKMSLGRERRQFVVVPKLRLDCADPSHA